jgi:hydrogenase/urease accessory protein HupE
VLPVLLVLLTGWAPAQAHELSIAEMEVRETAPGEFQWLWSVSGNRPAAQELTPQWPQGCRASASQLVCGAGGLQGKLSIDGVGKRYSAVLLRVFWRDGPMRVYTLTGSQPSVRLFGSADDQRGAFEIASVYAVLGIEHILSGIDHLLFVMALLFLVGFQRRLLWTITAFTVAHSLTLASAALGWLTLRPPPVEACIALSIVLVASEALRQRDTLARRWPAFVAFLFGLVHGLGFAGALKEIGLPDSHLPVALLSFNLGVEAGQLLTVLVAWLLVQALHHPMLQRAEIQGQVWALRLRAPALYVIGIAAAYWTWSRVAAILM